MAERVEKLKGKALDALQGGPEPDFTQKDVCGFVRALNWYSNIKAYKDSKVYTLAYLKQHKYDSKIINKVSTATEWEIKNLGYVLRMVSRGYQASLEQLSWIDSRIVELSTHKTIAIQTIDVSKPIKPKDSIQDKIYNQCTIFINEIEDKIDARDYSMKVYEYLTNQSCKSIHIKQIIEHFKPLSVEVNEVIVGEDEQLIEGYSNYNKNELKKLSQFLKLILSDCNGFTSNSKVTKTPRKKKIVSVSKKVLKLNYKKEDTEYKIVSIKPENIIGCQNLWIFNTKTRKLGIYVASDESGLSVKGSTIENFNTELSINKTVRKPLDIVPNVVKGKKTVLKKVMSEINSVETPLNGRINQDIILLTSIT
jgi:hypothetical protein